MSANYCNCPNCRTENCPAGEPSQPDGGAHCAVPSGSHVFPHNVQTAFVFAARYTHDRPTGGAFAITRALAYVWQNLDSQTQEQILRESHDATCNLDDWAAFRGDNANEKAETRSP